MNHQPNNHNAGFTLIEILVAMAIFTIIGLASTGVLNSVINSDQLSSERFEKLEELQRAMLTLERDILQIVPRKVRINSVPVSAVISGGEDVFDSDADGLGFVRAGWHNPQMLLPRSTLQAVGYRIQGQQLQRLYGNYVDNVIGYEPKVKILLSDIEDFRVSFLTQYEQLEEPEEWQETYSSDTLPIAISITIVSKIFGEIRREFILANGI
ncbi:type II secretion system minor pseudopilin GspJ [Paraglaciecola psychrophila]|jgi:general secretion pathway protein J|uniref:Type II secretion system protein J n=1 Tax=Paraglaciecola psychrophila 170 TaxID=1129794 RepID=K7ACM8_9ALTE|nr:type II secretion system minor pseudopilin GspJ [Paraglaciecola psychrophila]AGH47575.1 general secretion pathway protein J [Paraglaciecola psychrophila 170]GAC40032.1 general secretion pathway protein J [Paraglaciecola psychrophila 170]